MIFHRYSSVYNYVKYRVIRLRANYRTILLKILQIVRNGYLTFKQKKKLISQNAKKKRKEKSAMITRSFNSSKNHLEEDG